MEDQYESFRLMPRSAIRVTFKGNNPINSDLWMDRIRQVWLGFNQADRKQIQAHWKLFTPKGYPLTPIYFSGDPGTTYCDLPSGSIAYHTQGIDNLLEQDILQFLGFELLHIQQYIRDTPDNEYWSNYDRRDESCRPYELPCMTAANDDDYWHLFGY